MPNTESGEAKVKFFFFFFYFVKCVGASLLIKMSL